MLKLPLPGQVPHIIFFILFFSLVAGRYTGRGNWQVYSPGFWLFSALGVSRVQRDLAVVGSGSPQGSSWDSLTVLLVQQLLLP